AAAAAADEAGAGQAPPESRASRCRTAITTSSSGSSIAGRSWGRASSAWKPSQPLPHRHHDQQQQRQQRRTKLGPGKLRLEAEPAAAAPPPRPAAVALPDEAMAGQAPPGSRASRCRTATTTSSGGGSSSIAGVDASPAWKEAELATAAPPRRPAAAAAAAAALPDEAQQDGAGAR
ncbi:hypothetical protein PR001_g30430, partial [Phytophthora rubi]